jgi:hypothetical protein
MGSIGLNSLVIKKAKTQKGRKILESKDALNVENQKSAIFLKGTKCS